IALAGCLKDKAFDNGEIQSGSGHTSTIQVVSIGLTVSNTSNFLVASFDNSNNDTTINLVPIELGGTSAASQDIHVTLVANNTLIDDYNLANTDTTVTPTNPDPTGVVTHYIPAPSTVYTVTSLIVIIPKGSRTGYLQIKFKPSDFLGKGYAVAYTISSVAEAGYTISGNLQNGIVAIGIKNEFDADYTVTGWFFHPAAGRAISLTKHLSTASAIGLTGGLGDLGSPFTFNVVNNQLVWVNGPYTGVGSNGFMTIDNPGGVDYSSATNAGHVPGDAIYNSTIYNNTYDPATQTFYMHYGYNAGVLNGGQGSFTRQVYEKWVRQ
ncbi:MAG: DUF1735 domain-containing protein, partial [Ginsengibacter sp.]